MAPTGPAQTWPDLTTTLLGDADLTREQTRWAMDAVMAGEADPVAVAGFLIALRAKGESVAEVEGLVDVMLERAVPLDLPGDAVDVVGTGGDRFGTVNISTMSAIALAATGQLVVKHGNRAASSRSGAADVLECLGIDLTHSSSQVAAIAAEAGITFAAAGAFHPSMRHAAPARAGLGVPTVFNLLGPLTNPAQPRWSCVGVAAERAAPLIAGVFAARGRDAVVVRGEEGLDEVSPAGPTRVWWVQDGRVTTTRLTPEQLGVRTRTIEQIRGGDGHANAAVARAVLSGEDIPARDAVLLNAGLAHTLSTTRAPFVDLDVELPHAVRESIAHIERVLDDGSALAVLDRWVAASRAAAAV